MRLDIKLPQLALLALMVTAPQAFATERLEASVIYEMNAFDDQDSAYINAMSLARDKMMAGLPRLVITMISLDSDKVNNYSKANLLKDERVIAHSLDRCADGQGRCYSLTMEAFINTQAIDDFTGVTDTTEAQLQSIENKLQ